MPWLAEAYERATLEHPGTAGRLRNWWRRRRTQLPVIMCPFCDATLVDPSDNCPMCGL